MTHYKSPDDNQTYLYHLSSMEIWDSWPTPATTHSYAQSDIFDLDFNPIDDVHLPYTLDVDNSDQLFGDNVCTNPVTNDILNCWYTKTNNYGYGINCNIFFVKTGTFSNSHFLSGSAWSFSNSYGVLCFDDGYLIPFTKDCCSGSDPVSLKAAILNLNGDLVSNEVIKITDTKALKTGSYSSNGGSNFNATLINESATGLFVINLPAITESLYGFFSNGTIHIYKDKKIHVHPNNFADVFLSDTIDFMEDCCYISLYPKQYWHADFSSSYDIFAVITDIYGDTIKTIDNDTSLLMISNLTSLGTSYFYPQFIDLPMLSMSVDNDTMQSHYFAILYYNDSNGNSNYTSMNVYYLTKTDAVYQLVFVGTFDTFQGVNYMTDGKVSYMAQMNVYNIPGSSDIHIMWDQAMEVHVNNSYHHYYDIYGQKFEVSFTAAPSYAPTAMTEAPSYAPTDVTQAPTTSPIGAPVSTRSNSSNVGEIVAIIVSLLVVLLIGAVGSFIYYKRRKMRDMDHTFLNMNETTPN